MASLLYFGAVIGMMVLSTVKQYEKAPSLTKSELPYDYTKRQKQIIITSVFLA